MRHAGAMTRAVVVGTGVTLASEREVLSCTVDDTEDEAFWTEFGSGRAPRLRLYRPTPRAGRTR